MKRIIVGWVISVLVLGTAHAQDAARMEQVIRSFTDARQFMGTVLVARGDQVVLDKAYGSANLEWNIPNTPSTRFRLGSITKQFTAASVLLLEERGKLKTDDPVRKYFPEAPAAWDGMTLFHVLTHTAGIPNFTARSDYGELKLKPTTPEKQLPSLFEKPLEFKVGDEMKYSNSGYLLLGVLIERVSGKPYADFVQENIFGPLGMRDSGYDTAAAVIPQRAAGYMPSRNGPINAPYIDMSVPFAAGALYSTTGDLLKWERGLFGGKVISPASLKKMTTPFKNDYAFGLAEVRNGDRRALMHDGGIEGFNTYLAYYPDSQITVAVLANLNGNAPREIGSKLGALANGETVTLPGERKAITVSEDVLKKYVGTYALTPTMNMVIRQDGSQLTAQLGAQPVFPLFAESPTKFFLKVVDAQIEFFEEGGSVTRLVLYQNGREGKAARVAP